MEVKYLRKEIQELNRMEHFKMLSDRGKEKLKEYEYLVNLHECKVKELNLAFVSVPEGTVCDCKETYKGTHGESYCAKCHRAI